MSALDSILRRVTGWLSGKPDWAVWGVALVTFANGAVNVFQTLPVRFSPENPYLTSLLPFGIEHWSRSLTLAAGFVLMYLSLHIARRQRMAWWLALTVAFVAALTNLAHAHPNRAAVPPSITLLVLLQYRAYFTGRSEARSLVKGLAVLLFGTVLALGYGTAGFLLLDRGDTGVHIRAGVALLQAARELTLLGNSDLRPATWNARWFVESLRTLGLAVSVICLYSLFRPLAYRLVRQPANVERAEAIVQRYSTSSLDYFKLTPDKSYFFTPDRRSCIAYVVEGGVAISLGDPLGPVEQQRAVIGGFCRYCGEQGWAPAFLHTGGALLSSYRAVGLKVIKIGEEAMIDLGQFAAVTARKKYLRYVQRTLSAQGYRELAYSAPLSAALLDELQEVSDEWLTIGGRRERGFIIGRFQRSYVASTAVRVLRDAQGRALAFVNELPSYVQGEATIDLMRRRVDLPNGAMDFVLIRLMLDLHAQGYHRFNLGLAPLAGVGRWEGACLEEKALGVLVERFGFFSAYQGLRLFKDKFRPVWEPRYLVYQGATPGLVKTGIALARALR